MEFYSNTILRFCIFLFAIWIGGLATTIYSRIPNDVKIGPSHKPTCDRCGSIISFKYFFPIFGYIFSGGKCFHCNAKIPRVYLYLELVIATSIIFLSIKYTTFDEKFISKSLLLAYLITLLFIYQTHKIIKIKLVWMLTTFLLLYFGYHYNLPNIITIFFSCFIGYSSFELLKKYIKFDNLEVVLSVIILTSMPLLFSCIFFVFALLYFIIKTIFTKKHYHNKFYMKNYYFITSLILCRIIILFIDL